MTLFRALRVSLCASFLAAGPLAAQVQQGASSSPIDDLLLKAQQAFNDLNYLRADSIARQVLGAGGRITTTQRTRALLVIAAAYFPEEVPAQKRAEAVAALKQVVRNDIDVKIPAELTWSGLDSLLAETKRTTFGVSVSADTVQSVVGPSGQAQIRVRSNHPASFRLSIEPAGGGAPIVVDSLATTSAGVLTFPTMRNERPIFSTGEYEILISGTEAQSNDSATTRYIARITAPELTFARIPTTIDSSRLLAEHTGRYGGKGVVVGALVAGGIYAFSSVLRADTSLKRAFAADSKGAGVAAAAGAAIIMASFMDHGRPIPGAIAANQQLRTDLASSIRSTEAENAKRIATYTTTIAIQTAGGTR
jgi:hypothetical protein